MSNETCFRCPVCRASQTLRDTCRRCEADLTLVHRAHLRLIFLKTEQERLSASGDSEGALRLAAEIRWLAPSR